MRIIKKLDVKNIINEIYPNKGESKKDFISRFMSVTKDEYPDIKQRYAVANSYWNRRKLKESTRNQLLSKSKSADKYADGSGSRWNRKNVCKIANTVKDYNKLNMDLFWKKDILQFGIRIQGETNTYIVDIEFSNVLPKIQRNIERDKNKLEINCIYDALFSALNSSDVKINCSCPDYRYRLRYFNSKNGDQTGDKETRASNITNPNDTKGPACKHILAALNNAEWLRKIASVINNYINYCKDNMQYNYSKYIFPKLYGIPYEKAVQMTLNDYDSEGKVKSDLDSDEALLNLSNALGKVRGQFKKGSNVNTASKKTAQK